MKKPILSSLFPVAVLALASSLPLAYAETFTSTPGVVIPDGSAVGVVDTQTPASAINVIQGITLTLNITSPTPISGWNGDLYAYVQHITPGGTGFSILLNRTGTTAGDSFGYSDSGFSVTFSDAAANDIHLYNNFAPTFNAAGQLTGIWQPDGRNVNPNTVTDASPRTARLTSGTNPFTGLSAKGAWSLFVADLSNGSTMTLASWTLDISGISGPFYWKGQTDSSWSTIGDHISNWAADQAGTPLYALPLSTDDVIFSADGAANRNTTLDQNFTIRSLTINDTNPVSIGSGLGGPFTLTLSGAAGTGITVNTGADLTVSANVTLGGASDTIAVNGTGLMTISGVLAGTNGLNKTGSGKLTLSSGLNTYTGVTTISAGALSIGLIANGGAVSDLGQSGSAAANLVFDGGTLQYTGATATSDRAFTINNAKTATIEVTLAGTNLTLAGATGAATTGGLDKIGPGTLTLSGGNTYTGTTNVTAGRLNIDGSTDAASQVNIATAGTLGGNGTINGNATLTGNGVIDFGATGNIVGTLGVTGGNWNGQGTVGGQVTSSSGNFNIGSGANLTATTGVAVTGGTISATDGTAKLTGSLNYTSTANSIFTGVIAGAGSVVTVNIPGATTLNVGQLDLRGNNTYGGATQVTSGNLRISSSNALSGSGVIVASGANLIIANGANVGAIPLSITGDGTDAGGPVGALFGASASGTVGYAGAITLAGNARIGMSGGNGFNLTGGINNAGFTLTFGAPGQFANRNINVNSVISGAGDVAVDHQTANYNSSNTYAGSTAIINGGTLNANVAGALPAPAADGGTGTVRSAVLMDQSGSGSSKLTLGADQAIASLTGAASSQVNLGGNILTIGLGAGTTDFLGTISGTGGSLIKDGASTQKLSGANAYTGTTTVNGGTLLAGSTSAFGTNLATTVNAGGTLDFGGFSHTLGSLAGTAGGTVQNSTANAATVTTGGLNTSTTFAGVIQDGPGAPLAFVKNGTGAQTLSGNSSYTGGTTLNAGTLAAGNAKAFGSGDLTLNTGTLRTTGPLSVDIGAGNILFNGGTYVANVGGTAAGVNHDQLRTTGTANIGGGTLALVQQGGYVLAPGDKVKLLLADGGVAGGSAAGTPAPAGSVTGLAAFSNSPLIVPAVNLYTDKVILEATQGSFVSLAGTLGFTPNQLAVAIALDKSAALVGNKTGIIAEFNFLDTQPIGTLLDNLNKIAPDELTAIFTNAVALANLQSANLQRHFDDIHSGSPTATASGMAAAGSGPNFTGPLGPKGKPSAQPAPADAERWGVFLMGSGEFTRIGSTTNAAGFRLETAGVTGGIDYRVSDHFAIGLDFGYVGTTATLVNGGSIDTDGGRLGIYATYFKNNFHVDAAVNGGLNSYRTKRVTPNNTVAIGSPDGSEINILLATGYDWKIGKFTVGPTASYQYTNVRLDGFTEAGAFLPLVVAGQTSESSRTAFGLHATYDLQVGKVIVRPEARLSWQHEFGATTSSITSRFANIGGAPFTVTGPQVGRDSLLVGAGVSVQWSPRCATYLYYDGEIGRTNYSSHSISGGFRIQF